MSALEPGSIVKVAHVEPWMRGFGLHSAGQRVRVVSGPDPDGDYFVQDTSATSERVGCFAKRSWLEPLAETESVDAPTPLDRLRNVRDAWEPSIGERRPADSGRVALRVRGGTWADLEAEAIRMADKVFGSGGWVVLSPLDAETKRVEPGDDDVVLTATVVMAPHRP